MGEDCNQKSSSCSEAFEERIEEKNDFTTQLHKRSSVKKSLVLLVVREEWESHWLPQCLLLP